MNESEFEDPFLEISALGSSIRLEPEKLLDPDTEDDYDRSWISTKVKVTARELSGEFYADLMTVDYEVLKRQFQKLDKDFDSNIQFGSAGGQIIMTSVHDGQGHFKLNCKIIPDTFWGHNLNLTINFEQTEILKFLIQLETITKRFPMEPAFKLKD